MRLVLIVLLVYFSGHNQTLEFLGDTILQFISSEYLFKHFPDHHEGHLTVSNRAEVTDFPIYLHNWY